MHVDFLHTDEEEIPAAVRDAVAAVLAAAHADVLVHLPALSPRYLVTVRYDERTNVHTGEMGRLVTPYWLDWVVHPRRDRSPLDIVAEHLRASFVHETHHAVRAQLMSATKPHPVGPENPVERSLLVPARTRRMVQIAVEEGLASRFEHDLCPQRQRLVAAPDEPIEAWTSELIALGEGDYFEWFFDHPSGRRNIGYKVGAHLADRAIERSGRSAADLVAVDVDELCRLAGY